MGGHSAWRKRVKRGELAKGSGGAIMRHRPHFGRKGKDLILNRKGHIAGGNPKKRKKKRKNDEEEEEYESEEDEITMQTETKSSVAIQKTMLRVTMAVVFVYAASYLFFATFYPTNQAFFTFPR
ncbi:expressed unknown protein [Seminavis robusta]|uniref:Transmembrane protein n=1 Tax=Seminavis robusta TaxID=568900 RepID=A0A9N8HRK5_9STRA|nr:expressed unknown protein [Seminavis robusta]|eukprot:Sro1083_g239340.1 n/a (124) ;mRNA; f:12509-12880